MENNNVELELKNGRFEVVKNPQSGLTTFVSWERLSEQLTAAGQINENEKIVGFSIDENGIKIRARNLKKG